MGPAGRKLQEKMVYEGESLQALHSEHGQDEGMELQQGGLLAC